MKVVLDEVKIDTPLAGPWPGSSKLKTCTHGALTTKSRDYSLDVSLDSEKGRKKGGL